MAELLCRAAKYFGQFGYDCAVIGHRLAEADTTMQCDALQPDITGHVKTVPVAVLLSVIGRKLDHIVRGAERLATDQRGIQIEHRQFLTGSLQTVICRDCYAELFKVRRSIRDVVCDEKSAIDAP